MNKTIWGVLLLGLALVWIYIRVSSKRKKREVLTSKVIALTSIFWAIVLGLLYLQEGCSS